MAGIVVGTMTAKTLALTILLLAPLSLFGAENAPLRWITLPGPPVQVNGLPWYSENGGDLFRLPTQLKDTFRPPVWDLAKDPSGGRIRFRTNSSVLAIRLEYPKPPDMANMHAFGETGVDLYADGVYRGTAIATSKSSRARTCWDRRGATAWWTAPIPTTSGSSGWPRAWQAAWPKCLASLMSVDPAGSLRAGKPAHRCAGRIGLIGNPDLDLGDVRDVAEVRINGRQAGTLLFLPYRLNVTTYLQAGNNDLEIVVQNTLRNRMVGDGLAGDPNSIVFRNRSFGLSSGQMGLVRLLPSRAIRLD